MENQNLTVEQFKALKGTRKLIFSIFMKKDESGVATAQYSHNEDGTVRTYTDQLGQTKNLPKVCVRDTAGNIVAFCSAAVAEKKLLGGKATEGTYFQPFVAADGNVSYQLRLNNSSEKYSLGEEE